MPNEAELTVSNPAVLPVIFAALAVIPLSFLGHSWAAPAGCSAFPGRRLPTPVLIEAVS